MARLTAGDATVGELAQPHDISVQAISDHIEVLADAGLVSRRKDAKRRPDGYAELDALVGSCDDDPR